MVPLRPYMDMKVKTLTTVNDDSGVLPALYRIRPGIHFEKQAAASNLACEGCESREKDPDPSGIQPPTCAVELLKAPASPR